MLSLELAISVQFFYKALNFKARETMARSQN